MRATGRVPLVFIVSGPSGSGKSTLVKKLVEVADMRLSVSCTTRPPRPTERPGEWYNFVPEEEFRRKIETGEFLEYACVFGRHYYGTPRGELDRARTEGKDLVLEIDVQGAAQVKRQLPGAVGIFILPPSREELERRLRERSQDSEDEIERRLNRARQEMASYGEYEYVVVNDDIEDAGRRIQAVAVAVRLEVARNRERIAGFLASFEGATQ
ncbi:MAG TPA: guanylate kinase [Candidatus Dormibacteraeota bacterium]|nr:guanylate kinase [Candidatus Dormibacteraeota bacterium]